MTEFFNSAADVKVQTANNEITETCTMSNVQVDTDGNKATTFLFMILLREFAIEKLGFERSTKERLSVEEFGLLEVTRSIADNILFDVTKAIEYDEEKRAFKLCATEGKVVLEVDTYFYDELSNYYSRKMFNSAMDAYLHTQKTCTMLIDNLLHMSLQIDFEDCKISRYNEEDYPFYDISFSWELKDNENEEQFVDSSTKKYVLD